MTHLNDHAIDQPHPFKALIIVHIQSFSVSSKVICLYKSHPESTTAFILLKTSDLVK